MRTRLATSLAGAVLLLASCSQPATRTFDELEPAERGPTVVISFPLLGDVVEQILDGHGVVIVVHPEGQASALDAGAQSAIRGTDLVLVHGGDDEEPIVLAAGATPDGAAPPRVERVDTLLDPAPATPTWFDPIDMARIALALGPVLAEVDDAGLRTADEWFEAAEDVATDIAATWDVATERLEPIPPACRRAVGDDGLLEVLELRFDVRPATVDEDAADLSTVRLRLDPGQRWQDWFLAIIDQVEALDPGCDVPASPSPSPTSSP